MAVTGLLGGLGRRLCCLCLADCVDRRGNLYVVPRDNENMRCLSRTFVAPVTRGMHFLLDWVYQLGSSQHLGLWKSRFGRAGPGVGIMIQESTEILLEFCRNFTGNLKDRGKCEFRKVLSMYF